MFGFFSRKKKSISSGVRTIPIADLAPLWRGPDEGIAVDSQVVDYEIDTEHHGHSNSKSPVGVDSRDGETTPDLDRIMNNSANGSDLWFDTNGFFSILKAHLDASRTSAFQYNGRAYYTIDTIAKVLNDQRKEKNLELLDPQAVIDFFKSDRGLESGKYVMRFDQGLPTKIYLYSHPYLEIKKSVSISPVDETGRRLKSMKPIKKHKP
jgi:hypothetical protein